MPVPTRPGQVVLANEATTQNASAAATRMQEVNQAHQDFAEEVQKMRANAAEYAAKLLNKDRELEE